MKKFIFTFLVILSLNITFSNKCYAQYSKGKSHQGIDGNNIGYGMMVGGALISVAGFITAPDWYYVNSTSTQINFTGTQRKNKPFFQQGPRTMAICSGVTLTITGLLTSLANRN